MVLWTWTLAISSAVILLTTGWMKYQKALARVCYLPSVHLLGDPFSLFAFLLPRVKGFTMGPSFPWTTKYSIFQEAGRDIYTLVGLFSSNSGYHVSDLDAIKQMTAPRSAFTKVAKDYDDLRIFGENLVVTEGEQWKRQRRICAPAFSDRNNRLVWKTVIQLTDDIMMGWAKDRPTRISDICKDITTPFSLCVIANAGFGQDVKWSDDGVPPVNHQTTFKGALITLTEGIYLMPALPNWAWGLRKQWRLVRQAYDEVKVYLHEMIDSRRNLGDSNLVNVSEKDDLFNQLISAHDSGDELTTSELLGNIFLFLIAGHETTSHTLGFLFGLLALYMDEQDRLVEQINQIESESNGLTYSDLNKMTYLNAVMNETLRLYPAVILIPKHASTDTELRCGVTPNTPQAISVPANTRAMIHVPGLHYNPKYWDDPLDFNPSRFLNPNWNRDAFIPFSAGPRSCIGRRFAETTMAALLIRMLPKYRVSVDESKFKSIPGESATKRRERFMNASSMLTLAPGELPLVFTPRD